MHDYQLELLVCCIILCQIDESGNETGDGSDDNTNGCEPQSKINYALCIVDNESSITS